ncbi:MAG: iron uptake transporter deferrochelatase/peroxidase subunit [Jatrophihabitans sp.]|uniref:iron uptake transporter deferrochelatase/peroxidase subunit n=1 Tax=Jatrophihabitans sp. TaxID=1932789 RepID=UPI003F80F40E
MTATSRRRFLGGGLGALGLAAAGGTGYALASGGTSGASGVVPFYGRHQAGITTPAQDRLAFAAFTVTTTDAAALQRMLGTWAAAAAQLTAGRPVGAVETAPLTPPIDTGEAMGLPASSLTITVGFGSSLFDDRFGLRDRRPAALVDLPAFPGDTLDPARSGGDIGVQACADDPQVAFHAIRNLARLARGTAVLRWTQLGFGRTSSTSTSQQTPRNLMGFKDGTANIKGEDTADLDRWVWADGGDQAWMAGGSYLVARRVRMLVESWDTASLGEQERTFGRVKDTGAPIGKQHEFDRVDFERMPADAHVRLAAPTANGGAKLLRRGYSYTDGIDPETGLLDAGLFFLAYQADPRAQFVPIQQRLGQHDALNEYIRHTGSAILAVPPGLQGPGDWWGRALFA